MVSKARLGGGMALSPEQGTDVNCQPGSAARQCSGCGSVLQSFSEGSSSQSCPAGRAAAGSVTMARHHNTGPCLTM